MYLTEPHKWPHSYHNLRKINSCLVLILFLDVYTINMYEQTIQRLKEERDAAVKQTQQLQHELDTLP